MSHNKMALEFFSKSENEGFARVSVAAFIAQLDPTMDEISDVKTAVSEDRTVRIEAEIYDNEVTIIVSDKGKGIEDIKQAMEPLYTSRPDLERSGMGFTVMDTFMDYLRVESEKGAGTRVIIKKKFSTAS